ncbi:hypothetical protein HNY73_004111 [Argiope bruennichi]|uniref:Uncharacterized protein n=1 Tax=Argiope bruennichi TaxID=94029 RepID=A0A8T0FMW1_ARGBR|nr:hypothetical protein HNY73_004111 [Argiope bruennichi]
MARRNKKPLRAQHPPSPTLYIMKTPAPQHPHQGPKFPFITRPRHQNPKPSPHFKEKRGFPKGGSKPTNKPPPASSTSPTLQMHHPAPGQHPSQATHNMHHPGLPTSHQENPTHMLTPSAGEHPHQAQHCLHHPLRQILNQAPHFTYHPPPPKNPPQPQHFTASPRSPSILTTPTLPFIPRRHPPHQPTLHMHTPPPASSPTKNFTHQPPAPPHPYKPTLNMHQRRSASIRPTPNTHML